MLSEQEIRTWKNRAQTEWDELREQWRRMRESCSHPSELMELEDRVFRLKVTVHVLERVLNGVS